MPSPVIHNSGNNEWYTPPYVLDIARDFLGDIEFDPASCEVAQANVRAARWSDDSLDGPDWEADTIWMNPPYARALLPRFVNKFIRARFRRACVLVNATTDTLAAQALMARADAILFFNHRIKFLDRTGRPAQTPTQGQMMLFYGGMPGPSPHGVLVTPAPCGTRPLVDPPPTPPPGPICEHCSRGHDTDY